MIFPIKFVRENGNCDPWADFINLGGNSLLFSAAGYLIKEIMNAAANALGMNETVTSIITFVPKGCIVLGAAGALIGGGGFVVLCVTSLNAHRQRLN